MRLKFAAYHEAGHAVLADHFNVLEEVTLSPTPLTRFADVNQDVSCCIHYGGVLAQAKYQRRSLAATWLTAGHKDLEYISRVVALKMQWLGQAAYDLRTEWCRTARMILLPRWHAVNLVASGLLEHGHLDARRVRELVLSAS